MHEGEEGGAEVGGHFAAIEDGHRSKGRRIVKVLGLGRVPTMGRGRISRRGTTNSSKVAPMTSEVEVNVTPGSRSRDCGWVAAGNGVWDLDRYHTNMNSGTDSRPGSARPGSAHPASVAATVLLVLRISRAVTSTKTMSAG